MSVELYCPIYKRLKESWKLKPLNCPMAEKCPKRIKQCVILDDIRAEELGSLYATSEDIAQILILQKLEAESASRNARA